MPNIKTVQNQPGIYYYESTKRKYRGNPDRCLYIAYKDNTGKIVREKVGWLSDGYNIKYAINLKNKRLIQKEQGEIIQKRNNLRMTFSDAWNKYDRDLDDRKKHTYDDRNRYKNYIKDKFGPKILSKITPHELEQFKISLSNKSLAPQTVKHILVIIRQVYNKMIAWGFYEGHSPTKGIEMPKIDNKRSRFLSHKDADNLIKEVKNRSQQTYEISLLSLHTGMRASEVFGLLWGHIDFENDMIHVADSKGGSRDVFLTKKTKKMLLAKKRGNRGDLVFISRKGGEIGDVSRAFLRSVREKGW